MSEMTADSQDDGFDPEEIEFEDSPEPDAEEGC